MNDANDFTILKMPKLPSAVKTYLASASVKSKEEGSTDLTWIYVRDGYMFTTDGRRVHAVRTQIETNGIIRQPHSIADLETRDIWPMVKPYLLETRRSAVVNTGLLIEQSQNFISRAKKGRNYWYQSTLYLDQSVLSLIPYVRSFRSYVVPLLTRGDEPEGLKIDMDLRYMKSALWGFDPSIPTEITVPHSLTTPIRFQQGDFISLVMPMSN